MGEALLMAMALSLDGLGVGLAYGLRRIKIPLGSLVMIALCTVVAMGTSMLFGSWVSTFLQFIPVNFLGAGLLLGIGIFQLIRAFKHRGEESITDLGPVVPAMAGTLEKSIPLEEEKSEPLFLIRLRLLGLVIQVMRTPDLADMDRSGAISWRESIILGSALAMDAFAAGLGAAMAGMMFMMIGVVALVQMLIIRLGQILAGKVPERLMGKAAYLPGIILIAIGLGKLI